MIDTAPPINNGLTRLIGLLRELRLFCFTGVHKFCNNLKATPKFEDATRVTIRAMLRTHKH